MRMTGIVIAIVLGLVLYMFVKKEMTRQANNPQRLALDRQLAQDRLAAEFLRKSEPSAAQLAQGTTFEEEPSLLVFRQ